MPASSFLFIRRRRWVEKGLKLSGAIHISTKILGIQRKLKVREINKPKQGKLESFSYPKKHTQNNVTKKSLARPRLPSIVSIDFPSAQQQQQQQQQYVAIFLRIIHIYSDIKRRETNEKLVARVH